MIKILLNNNLSIVKFYIRNIPGNVIFQFLQERTTADIALLTKEYSDQIEYLFYQLDQPLINLGLACYGENTDILRNLYESSCFEIRLATLGNKKTFQDQETPYNSLLKQSEIKEILLSGNTEEQQAILKNSNISSELLFQLFCKTEIFDSISELEWQKLISYSIGNEKLQSLPTTYPFTTSYKKWREVITSAWKLTIIVKVTDDWACLLMGLSESLYKLDFIPINEIIKTINRWQKPQTDIENEDAYFSIRMHLADFIPINSTTVSQFTESNDQAMKSSYYKRFVPSTENEISMYFKIDREQFFIFAIQNENIIKSKKYLETIYQFSVELDNDELFYTHLLEKLLKEYITCN